MSSLIIVVLLWIVAISLILALMYTLTFSISMIFGAVFVPSNDATLKTMLQLAAPSKKDRIVDLGSGDGKVVIALAERGYAVTGIEINPILVRRSRAKIQKLGLEKLVKIERGSFWKHDFSRYDLILVYGTTYIMKRLEEKLQRELKPGARVVSNYFQFPNWKPSQKKGIVRVYTKQ